MVQQVVGNFKCLNGSMNTILDKCLDIIRGIDEFNIHYVPRLENRKTNELVQQSSGYNVSRGKNLVIKKAMLEVLELDHLDTNTSNRDSAESLDCRSPIVSYIHNPTQSVDRKVRHVAFKYTLIDGNLYHRMGDDLLLKCLCDDKAKVAMGEIHESICGMHQSALKMKWLLSRAGFYWLTMIADCYRYYKRCEECQRFSNIQLAPTAMMNPIIKPSPFRGRGLDFIG